MTTSRTVAAPTVGRVGAVAEAIQDVGQVWYRLVTPYQWRVWFAASLGWLFDGYEAFALTLVLIPAMTTLLPGATPVERTLTGGLVISGMLFGWATGGVLGGILSDYEPRSRRYLIATTVLSLATVVAYWANSGWIPAYAQSVAQAEGQANPAQSAAVVTLWYTAGAIIGYLVMGFIADRIGRRGLILVWFVGSLITTSITFIVPHTINLLSWLALVNGFFTLGQFAWMSIYLPELFPTVVRGTAASFVFSTTRYFAAIGPFIAGALIASFGGFGQSATIFALAYLVALPALLFLPETTGQPMPE
jgi:MFS family permease